MICATRALGITYQNLLLRNVCGIHVYFCASYTQEGINERVPKYTVKKSMKNSQEICVYHTGFKLLWKFFAVEPLFLMNTPAAANIEFPSESRNALHFLLY